MSNGDTIEDDWQDGVTTPPPRWRLRPNFRATWQRALDAILPPVCIGCDNRLFEHDTLCPACWRGIDFIRAPLCDRLGIPLPYDTGGIMISAAAAADPPVYDRARAVARFDGLMRELVHGLKFADTHDGRRLFGRWLISAGGDLIKDADVIIPVPLSRWRLLSRRFNQAQILASEVARLSDKPSAATVLLRHRATKQQVGLTRGERKKNVAGAFSVAASGHPLITGKSVLLIDDVITTGATVSAAARALKRAGASKVDVLALAIVSDPGHIM